MYILAYISTLALHVLYISTILKLVCDIYSEVVDMSFMHGIMYKIIYTILDNIYILSKSIVDINIACNFIICFITTLFTIRRKIKNNKNNKYCKISIFTTVHDQSKYIIHASTTLYVLCNIFPFIYKLNFISAFILKYSSILCLFVIKVFTIILNANKFIQLLCIKFIVITKIILKILKINTIPAYTYTRFHTHTHTRFHLSYNIISNYILNKFIFYKYKFLHLTFKELKTLYVHKILKFKT
jgi:hypothetical protein